MIFLDTGAFVARFVVRDQFHDRAIQHWQQLQQDRRPCYTSNFVLDETFTLLARKTTYQFAAERAHNLLHSTALIILRPDSKDELAAMDFFRQFSDQRVSFTDCVSFVLMKKCGITHVFTFDRHFSLAGFIVEP